MLWSRLRGILRFLKTTDKNHPIKGGIYAILGGNYGGEFFVYIKQDTEHFTFVSLPQKTLRFVPKKSFNDGITFKLIEFIEILPKKVLNVIEKEILLLNSNDGLCISKTNN